MSGSRKSIITYKNHGSWCKNGAKISKQIVQVEPREWCAACATSKHSCVPYKQLVPHAWTSLPLNVMCQAHTLCVWRKICMFEAWPSCSSLFVSTVYWSAFLCLAWFEGNMRRKHVEHKKQAINNVIYVRNKCSSNLKSRYFWYYMFRLWFKPKRVHD